MKQFTSFFLLILLTSQSFAQAAKMRRPRTTSQPTAAISSAPTAKPTLPIRRVVLYSNGVAFFERRGAVNGNAEINLPFKQSQIDDVLKSMVVLDLGKGRIGAVSYNSSAPASARLTEIPFSIEAGTKDNFSISGLAGVLRQLQGARVAVTAATHSATGAILTVEERKAQVDASKPPVVSHALVVASESGELSRFDLAEVRAIKLLDEGARHDIREFADASASARRRDAKTITVTSDGTATREMSVIYTVAAPIWKTTYRIVVDATGQPFFQGWAIVDNVSDEDWRDVQLSLVSGTPVSFIQPIQQPLYRYRPVVPLPEDLQLKPQTYEASIEVSDASALRKGENVAEVSERHSLEAERARLGAPVSKQQLQNLPMNSRNLVQLSQLAPGVASATEPTTSLSTLITSEDSSVKTAATGSEVGDLFEYRIDQPVTVQRNRSALIPILQTKMAGERVSIYNEAVRRDRPLSGLRLKNTSPLTLEGGSLTIIDGDAYAGETLMDRLKPGEFRFITYALDLGTLVTANAKAERAPTFFVRIVNGALQAHYYQTEKKTYTITNQTDKPRIVYVQHPVRDGWALSDDTQKPAAKTNSLYAFRIEVAPRETKELPIIERQTLMESYAITDLTPKNIEFFVSRNYIDEAMRTALNHIIAIKGKMAALERRIEAIDNETEEIGKDQERLRENIKALKDTPETKQLMTRYIAKAGEQETRIEQLTTEKRAANTELSKLQGELSAAVTTLNFDRKL